MNSPILKNATVDKWQYGAPDISSPISPTSQTSSSSVSLNGPPAEAPPPLPPQHQYSQEDIAEDPFASAPFSLPSSLKARASNKSNRR